MRTPCKYSVSYFRGKRNLVKAASQEQYAMQRSLIGLFKYKELYIYDTKKKPGKICTFLSKLSSIILLKIKERGSGHTRTDNREVQLKPSIFSVSDNT